MGESVSPWIPSCNESIRVELGGQRTTSDSGALLLREALDNSGVINALEDNLVDRRHPMRIRHSLASQLRALVLQRAMGWIDLSDTDTLRRDPLWPLACSDAPGMTPLARERPSQATLSRLLTCLGVRSREEVAWVIIKSLRPFLPSLKDKSNRCLALERPQWTGTVVSP
ncbi:transposase [Chromohalobacter israelensis]|uniref:transposase n=1 Tax=Chromohalobacter israelensis TaxID=141390 RepID=UPI0021E12D68|nr:transposase [Chromohalobacter salexigens]